MSSEFSFIILTYNEQEHLPRLLRSIEPLEAPVYILDSGSTDDTLSIAENFGATIAQNPFKNHPEQWNYALNCFTITTPWIIALDADQWLSEQLQKKLLDFRSTHLSSTINGIYFNRKNYFRGEWIKYGGYYPKYLLKMFRKGKGRSDLNENMDHRFIIEGETTTWKDGIIHEENFKENHINFWISKHNRYSDLVAQEEIERRQQIRHQAIKPKMFGSPDERIAAYKKMWWKMPLYLRPFCYFFYRFFLQLGFLDGKQGRLFHFLQGFWFRMIVDMKIEEQLKIEKSK